MIPKLPRGAVASPVREIMWLWHAMTQTCSINWYTNLVGFNHPTWGSLVRMSAALRFAKLRKAPFLPPVRNVVSLSPDRSGSFEKWRSIFPILMGFSRFFLCFPIDFPPQRHKIAMAPVDDIGRHQNGHHLGAGRFSQWLWGA